MKKSSYKALKWLITTFILDLILTTNTDTHKEQQCLKIFYPEPSFYVFFVTDKI